MLLNPKRAEKKPWEMFFVGFVYAAISLVFANWLFADNPIFKEHISLLIITFTVMLSLPFFYFLIKLEEERDYKGEKSGLMKRHGKAINALIWLFLGYVVAYSLGYILVPSMIGSTFEAQIEQYCTINMPAQFKECVSKYGGIAIEGDVGKIDSIGITGKASSWNYAFDIFENNLYVMLFSIIFSLIFGAGAIFILAWNASVVATAIGIFSKSSISNLPASLSRYMLHGIPEIAAYFVAALGGGILGVTLIKHGTKDPDFSEGLSDSINLIALALLFLVIGAILEVFVTPRIF